jgi:hypothetical protein
MRASRLCPRVTVALPSAAAADRSGAAGQVLPWSLLPPVLVPMFLIVHAGVPAPRLDSAQANWHEPAWLSIEPSGPK